MKKILKHTGVRPNIAGRLALLTVPAAMVVAFCIVWNAVRGAEDSSLGLFSRASADLL